MNTSEIIKDLVSAHSQLCMQHDDIGGIAWISKAISNGVKRLMEQAQTIYELQSQIEHLKLEIEENESLKKKE